MKQIAKYRCGFYYDQLDIDHQFVYRRVAAAVSKFEPEISVDEGDQMLNKTKMAIKYDNPELCYWSADDSKEEDGKLKLTYMTSADEAENLVKQLREKKRRICEVLLNGEKVTETERIARVYDYLVETVSYAEDELLIPGTAPWIYDVRGPLLYNRGVCLGIAQTFNYISQALYVSTILVTGEAKIAGDTCNHGWNMVQLDGQFYHLDVTAEITDGSTGNNRRYFMKKDEDFQENRRWSRSLYPKAV